MNFLFSQFPGLKKTLAHVPLGNFPTPVTPLNELGKALKMDSLYLKNDGISGPLYGGNKIRKLEYLFGDAIQKGAKEILTFGAAGSNHALATAIYAKQLNFGCTSMLLTQPNAGYVRSNLKWSHASCARLCHYKSEKGMYFPILAKIAKKLITKGKLPYVIMPGGSSPVGTIGYVNAGLELKKQIDEGLLPEPDTIYVPLGTMGTAVGLIIGLKAAGLSTKLICVRVVETQMGNEKKFQALFLKTLSLIRDHDPTFPGLILEDGDIEITHDFFGEKYALFSKKGMSAVNLIKKTQGIKLEGTYTGKAMAALIHHANARSLKNKNILFWNTYNAIDFSDAIKGVDYQELPVSFHKYFKNEVQPLDRPN